MSPSSRFLIGFFGGAVALIGVLALAFVGLDEAGRLKAPSFANRLSFDEKLRHLRQHPVERVEALAIGSSTTLHGVDGAVLRQELGLEGEVVNLGVQDLRVNQIRFLADVFLSHYPRVRRVIMISTLRDYMNCTDDEVDFFNAHHVMDYLNGGWALYYYFKYLDVGGVFKRAGNIKYLRRTIAELESVSFDQYGSLLLEVPRERIIDRIWVGDPVDLDPPCYKALRAMAEELRERDLQFTFVIAPMRPGYLAGRDPDGSLLAEHHRLLRSALADTDALVVDAHAALNLPDEAFFDAYHVNRGKATVLTRFVADRLLATLSPPGEPASTGPAVTDDTRSSAGT